LSRLLLTSPVPSITLILPLIYNLILRHPHSVPLIHRALTSNPIPKSTESEAPVLNLNQPQSQTQEVLLHHDPYDFDELDPLKSNAVDSSLWELVVNIYYLFYFSFSSLISLLYLT